MVTNRLLHCHVFRTGGFLFRGILKKIEGLQIYNEDLHSCVDTMLKVCQENSLEPPPVVAFIRNPWEWYVSQWCWVTMAKPGYRSSFRSYLEAIRESSTSDPNLATMSYHYYAYMQAHRAVKIGRFENLNQDIESILMDLMPDLVTPEKIRELISSEPIHHPSVIYPTKERMEHYSRYYGVQTKGWVDRWDAALIAQFGYKFED